MSRLILVFGATGSVGVHTTLALKRDGYDVIAVGRRPTDHGFFSRYGVQYLSVDVANREAFRVLPSSGVTDVIHFAGAMPARMSGYHPDEYLSTIIDGTFNILEYIREVKASRIVFSQSIADVNYLYGSPVPIDPDVERRFPLTGDHSVYSISKNAAVNLIEHYYHEYGIQRFILRLPTIYVYHPDPYYHVNGIKRMMGYRFIMEQALKGKPIEVWGNPQRKKEIVYIKDFVAIVQGSLAASCDGGVYNVGRGVGVTLEEQIKGIVSVFSPAGNKSELIYRPDLPDAAQFILDIDKTKRDLKYVPQFDYLRAMMDYYDEMQKEPHAQLWGHRGDFVE